MALYRVTYVYSVDIDVEDDADRSEAQAEAEAIPLDAWDLVDTEIELLP